MLLRRTIYCLFARHVCQCSVVKHNHLRCLQFVKHNISDPLDERRDQWFLRRLSAYPLTQPTSRQSSGIPVKVLVGQTQVSRQTGHAADQLYSCQCRIGQRPKAHPGPTMAVITMWLCRLTPDMSVNVCERVAAHLQFFCVAAHLRSWWLWRRCPLMVPASMCVICCAPCRTGKNSASASRHLPRTCAANPSTYACVRFHLRCRLAQEFSNEGERPRNVVLPLFDQNATGPPLNRLLNVSVNTC